MGGYDITPNSNKYKAEQQKKAQPEKKKVEKIVKGNVKTTKKSELRKVADNFISEEASNIKTYLINDVVIPTIKNTIWDAFTNSLDMILFGGTGRSKRKSNGSYVSYKNYYDKKDRGRYDSDEPRSRSRFDLDEIKFDNKGDAEAVLDQMCDLIENYGIVSVADLYDMAGLSAPYTSNKYGWSNLRNADSVRVRDGYVLKLPKAMPID